MTYVHWQVEVVSGNIAEIKATTTLGLPPDKVFSILIDPDNKRVFKNIKVGAFFPDGFRQPSLGS